ncbi:MAG: hypothetical protein WCT77_02205 [Bacteroidota bacterium]
MKKLAFFNAFAVSLFFNLNMILVLTEKSVSEGTSELLFFVLMLGLLVSLFIINKKLLPDSLKRKKRFAFSFIVSSLGFVFCWALVYYFNWYLLYASII